MHEAIALTYLVAARIEPRPGTRHLPPPRRRWRRARAAFGALLVAIRRAPQSEPKPELRWRDLGERPATANGVDLAG